MSDASRLIVCYEQVIEDLEASTDKKQLKAAKACRFRLDELERLESGEYLWGEENND